MVPTETRRRILFLIRSFDAGGTERQLAELLRGLDRRRFDATVATLYDGGAFAREVASIDGITYHSLAKRSRWDAAFPWRLGRLLGQVRPHVLSSYLGVVNEAALCAGAALRVPVVWNIRSSYIDFAHYDWLPRASFRAGGWLSRWPALTVFNSCAGRRFHEQHGYRPRRAVVIQNGIDVDRYRPDRAARDGVRAAWGVRPDERLVGLVGRLDPMKDHATFLRACAEVARTVPQLRIVCVGAGLSPAGGSLVELSAALGLQSRVIWAGFRDDMAAVYNGLDLAVSSSRGEGFSNVIAESMASGTTCVVTDVGDSCDIVGETGTVVPAQLARPRDTLGAEARARIAARFSVRQMVQRTEDALDAV
jgi:glycosyltransferase involved in cell wall biosynthesis